MQGTGEQQTGRYGKRSSVQNVTKCRRGGVRRFSDLMGIRASDNRIDSRLWKGYRQPTDTNPDGDTNDSRESDKGDYP